jgi:hypothetical protein
MQYEALTGRTIKEDIDKLTRGLAHVVLNLPPAKPRSIDELREYYRLTLEALRKYA